MLYEVITGDWDRQVSLLAEESVDTMRAKGLELQSGAFAENIVTRGVTLTALAVGTRLMLGDALLEVTRIGKECHSPRAVPRRVRGSLRYIRRRRRAGSPRPPRPLPEARP